MEKIVAEMIAHYCDELCGPGFPLLTCYYTDEEIAVLRNECPWLKITNSSIEKIGSPSEWDKAIYKRDFKKSLEKEYQELMADVMGM